MQSKTEPRPFIHQAIPSLLQPCEVGEMRKPRGGRPHPTYIESIALAASDLREALKTRLWRQDLMGWQRMGRFNTGDRCKQAAMFIEKRCAKCWVMPPHEIHRFSTLIRDR